MNERFVCISEEVVGSSVRITYKRVQTNTRITIDATCRGHAEAQVLRRIETIDYQPSFEFVY